MLSWDEFYKEETPAVTNATTPPPAEPEPEVTQTEAQESVVEVKAEEAPKAPAGVAEVAATYQDKAKSGAALDQGTINKGNKSAAPVENTVTMTEEPQSNIEKAQASVDQIDIAPGLEELEMGALDFYRDNTFFNGLCYCFCLLNCSFDSRFHHVRLCDCYGRRRQ